MGLFAAFRMKPKTLLGLHVMGRSLQMIELGYQGTQYRVYAKAALTLPHLDQKVHPLCQSVCLKWLQKQLMHADCLTRDVALAVPDRCVLSKIIRVDKRLRDREISMQVTQKMQAYCQQKSDEFMMDFEVMGRCSADPDLNEVRWVAAKSQTLMPIVHALQQIKLRPVLIEATGDAICRVAQFILARQHIPKACVLLVYSDGTHCVWIVMQNGQRCHIQSEEIRGTKAACIVAAYRQVPPVVKTPPDYMLVGGCGITSDVLRCVNEQIAIKAQLFHISDYLDHKTATCDDQDFVIPVGLAMRVSE